ncbi:outer membrane beta-barrel protein [Paludibacter sp.]|uniref:outer membrane beta-barrel protein n=1 Tax=Paludibacter sp. TaxID=1898105 RepID=UPI0013528EE8|nr:outer membrane beta-barrel protein [Paludibacter sp.]MTK52940.1 outer membrane beta-barrel protein [Paludibacter sp.]
MMIKREIIRLTIMPVLIVLSVCYAVNVTAQSNVNTNNFLIWGSGGYSRISNDAPATNAVGNAGGAVGAGFEMHFKNNILLQTGLELSCLTSRMNRQDTLLVVPMIDTENNLYDGHFAFQNTHDMQQILNVGIPLMIGYESPNGLYFAVGGKAMLNLGGQSRATTTVTSTAYYENLIGYNNTGILSNMINHGLFTETRSVNSSLRLHAIFSGSVEAGYTFGKNPEDYSIKNKPKIRLSMICDYGFAPLAGIEKPTSLFVNTSATGGFTPAVSGYLLNNISSNRLNILYVGLKVTVLFGVKKYGCNCTKE